VRALVIWLVLALLLDAALAISYVSLGIAQRSGGDQGLWAVLLFYPLAVIAPAVSIIVFWRLLRRLADRVRPGPD